MAHLIEVHVVCDRCQAEKGVKVPAVDSIPIAFDKPPFREVDLCEEHSAAVAALRDLVMDVGRPLKKGQKTEQAPDSKQAKADKPADFRCDECERRFTSPQGVAAHRRTAHQDNGPLGCPECGRRCKGSLGLHTHRRAEHGIHATLAEGVAAAVPLDAERRVDQLV